MLWVVVLMGFVDQKRSRRNQRSGYQSIISTLLICLDRTSHPAEQSLLSCVGLNLLSFHIKRRETRLRRGWSQCSASFLRLLLITRRTADGAQKENRLVKTWRSTKEINGLGSFIEVVFVSHYPELEPPVPYLTRPNEFTNRIPLSRWSLAFSASVCR